MTPSGRQRRIVRQRRGITSILFSLLFFPAIPAKSTEVLTAGCEYGYPPFCVIDSEGRAGGFSVELFRAARSLLD